MPVNVTRDPATVLALSTFVKLRRSVNGLSSRLNGPLGRDHHLTETQFGVLEALYHLGPMPQARLCEKLLVSGSNLTTVIDNLERGGLVRRDPNPDDRRAYLVRLSDVGKSLIARAFPDHAQRVRALLGALTQAEQRELGRLCRKLGLGLGAAEGSE